MSSLENRIETLSKRVNEHSETIVTEEAVKTSVVLPFLQALGFDVFNPNEVIPEFTADAVGKKGEKVDYAVKVGNSIKILIECKGLSCELSDRHLSQLYRYFSVTEAKFALLTNGREFKFYSDLEEVNKLDKKPFFVFNILDPVASALNEIQKFQKNTFDEERILQNAERLKYVSAIKAYLALQVEEPTDDFVRVVASNVHDGRVTQHVREMIAKAIKTASAEFIREEVQSRLSSALDTTSYVDENTVSEDDPAEDIITTQEEVDGMNIIRAIICNVIEPSRIGIRDAKSYCAVLVDDNNRKPLARLHFNRKNWYLGVFDSGQEERLPISGLVEIYKFSDRLRATAEKYVES